MSAQPEFDLARWKAEHDLGTLITEVTGQPVRYGRNIHCPFHADDTPSLTVWQDGRWKCWGCGKGGDAYDFLQLVWDCDLRSLIDRLGDIAPRLPSPAPRRQSAVKPTLDPALVDKLEARMGDAQFRAWADDGITPHALLSLRVGHTGDRWAFPWFYRGVFTAMKLRRDDTVNPGMEPKYTSVTGSRFAAPYNIDAVIGADHVLIVEDEKSVLAATSYHLTAIAAPANQWKADWCDLLAFVPHVFVVADNDETGLKSAQKTRDMLRRGRVLVPPIGKDLFDLLSYWRRVAGDRSVVRVATLEWMEYEPQDQ